MDTAASRWLSANLADVLVAVARANATLAAQPQAQSPKGNPVGTSDYGSGANVRGLGTDEIRYPLDPNAEPVASEFSWGAGLEPKSVRGKLPSEGGRYRGTTPDCDPIIGVSRR